MCPSQVKSERWENQTNGKKKGKVSKSEVGPRGARLESQTRSGRENVPPTPREHLLAQRSAPWLSTVYWVFTDCLLGFYGLPTNVQRRADNLHQNELGPKRGGKGGAGVLLKTCFDR